MTWGLLNTSMSSRSKARANAPRVTGEDGSAFSTRCTVRWLRPESSPGGRQAWARSRLERPNKDGPRPRLTTLIAVDKSRKMPKSTGDPFSGARMTALPWLLHQDLTADRLMKVAGLIALGRSNALDRYDPEVGDNAWTLGCRAYAFGRHEIMKAIDDGGVPWLVVVDGGQQFTFRIGGVPVRFYRGPADDPHQRTLRQSFPELRQLSLALTERPDLRGIIFRFAVETGIEGELERIIFFGMIDETVECYWEVPFSRALTVLHPVQERRDEGVQLPPPPVGLPRPAKERVDGGGDAG
jgi:hypothetical protein